MRTTFCSLTRCITSKWFVLFALALLAMGITATPVSAQDVVPYFCNGTSAPTCNVFQLDGSTNAIANADTCVGSENGCPSEQNPIWPADWDALLYPSLTSGTVTVIGTGTPPGAYSFSLPWNSFGSFSGIFSSPLVTTGTSQIFKGGAKNVLDISTWTVASQSSPPKDAYLAGAVASYIGPPSTSYAGHELLYLGSTRFSSSGSATVGIWFFQENVKVCSTGTALCVDGTSTIATHKNGDLFLFLTYSGNGTATIQQATWVGNGTSGSLSPGSSLIACPAPGDQACAVTNALSAIILGSANGPQAPGTGFNPSGPKWPGFPGGVVPQLQFQEAGVDLNGVFNGAAPCFSSVLFSSVSSGSSPGQASLKSFLLGSFNTCAISVSKSCGQGKANISAGTVTYPISGTVENVGGGATSNLTLTDTFNNNMQSFDSTPSCTCGASGCTITGTDCTSVDLNPGGTVNYSATITTSSNGGSDQVTATMGGSGGGSATATSNTATCQTLSFSSGITITKSCSPGATLVAQSGLVAVQVGVDGTVSTSTTDQFTLQNVTVYDCVGGSWTKIPPNINPTDSTQCTGKIRTITGLGDLAPSGSESWSDTYFPTVVPTCGPFNFNDTAVVTATCNSVFCPGGKGSTVENISSQAICPLCPGPNCP